jgi:integrase
VAAERAAMTFDELAELYLNERVARQTPKSLAVVKSFLTGARQHFGTMKAKDIARADVIAYLREKAKAAPVAANRTRSIMSTLFAWAMDEGHVDTTPMIRIPKPATEQPKDRIIHDDELPLLWKAFDKLDASFAGAFRTLALLGQRPGEIAGLEVGEVYNLHDPEKARIELPADRVKNARRHVVPLPPRARQIIADAIARKQEHDDSPFVFPSFRNPGEAIDRHSFARAMVRLIEGLDGDDAATARLKAHRVTPHDFRRSMVTKLIELEFGRDLVKLLVNHAEGDITERHYDRASRLHERRRALEAYERHVLSLLGEAPTNRRVVALRGGRKA